LAIWGLNLSIDFKGGAIAVISYPDGKPTVAEIEKNLEKLRIKLGLSIEISKEADFIGYSKIEELSEESAEKSNFESKIPAAAIINSSCYNLRYNATINASLYPPALPLNKKLIFPLAAFFILILIILFAVSILVKRKEAEKPEKKEEPYWIEEPKSLGYVSRRH